MDHIQQVVCDLLKRYKALALKGYDVNKVLTCHFIFSIILLSIDSFNRFSMFEYDTQYTYHETVRVTSVALLPLFPKSLKQII